MLPIARPSIFHAGVALELEKIDNFAIVRAHLHNNNIVNILDAREYHGIRDPPRDRRSRVLSYVCAQCSFCSQVTCSQTVRLYSIARHSA